MEKKIVIDNQETNYIITSDGKIFNLKTNKELKGTIQRNEYHSVQLTINNKPKSFMVHRLVAEAFISNPNNYTIVDHIDGNKKNNNVNNLRWVDNKTNANNIKSRKPKSSVKSFNITELNLNEWKIIDSKYPQYRININGEIINLKTGKYVLGSDRNGYKRIMIGNNRYSIHRLVWETFNQKLQKDQIIDHIDGNRSNNKLENLRIVTQSENMKNAQLLGHKGQKPVIQYDLNGNKIAEYLSLTEAAQAVKVTYAAIASAIKRNGSCQGYKWEFKNKIALKTL